MSTRHMAARAAMWQELGRRRSRAQECYPQSPVLGPVTTLPLFPIGLGHIDVEADHHRHVGAPRYETQAPASHLHVRIIKIHPRNDPKNIDALIPSDLT